MGYDAEFLGLDVPIPALDDADGANDETSALLEYEHFSIVHDSERRFALVTAVNIDGDLLLDLPRNDRWEFDDRIPEEDQAGPAVYARNDLDRGHLVRRADPVWGDPETAQRANVDTFVFTNAAPQQGVFNQSLELWNGLEDHVLEFAEANRHRVSVFTAPVLAPTDPPYRGIRVPLRFWKIAAWLRGDELRTAGFVLDQSPVLDLSRDPAAQAERAAREAERIAAGDVPDLGPFRTFQVPITEIAALTQLDLTQLAEADTVPRAIGVGAERWREVTAPSELVLG